MLAPHVTVRRKKGRLPPPPKSPLLIPPSNPPPPPMSPPSIAASVPYENPPPMSPIPIPLPPPDPSRMSPSVPFSDPPPPPMSPLSIPAHVPNQKARPNLRTSITLRDACDDVLPKPHGLYWEVPTDWDASIMMKDDVTKACIRALLNRITENRFGVKVLRQEWVVDLLMRGKHDNYKFLPSHKKAARSALEKIVGKLEPIVLQEKRCAVMSIDASLHNKRQEKEQGHGIVAVFSNELGRMRVDILDGNGYMSFWHDPIMDMIGSVLHDRDSVHIDDHLANVNYGDTMENSKHLNKLGITHRGHLEGYCAFLQWVLIVNVLCVGCKSVERGHVNRLMNDILQADVRDNYKTNKYLDVLQQSIIKAYIHACILRILRIIAEDYPTAKERKKIKWPDDVEFPDVETMKSVVVTRDRQAVIVSRHRQEQYTRLVPYK